MSNISFPSKEKYGALIEAERGAGEEGRRCDGPANPDIVQVDDSEIRLYPLPCCPGGNSNLTGMAALIVTTS